jgi:hypothetical protein
MKQDRKEHRTANQRDGRPTAALATGVALSVLLILASASAAPAQTALPPAAVQPKAQPGVDPRFQAPIGHRQPRPQDLPPSVRRDEGHAVSGDRALDERLQICRQC